jgi:hypothetical protein
MAVNQINLFQAFQAVSKALRQNQTQLNQVDTYNHDHGDNMVEIFDVITRAMKEKRSLPSADQLEYAAKLLREKQSGSAQYYSQSLIQAARELQGKPVTADNAMTLLQTLLGGGQATSPSAGSSVDLLGSLLSSMGGSGTGAGTGQTQPGTIDWAALAGAGLEYLQSKQEGKDTMTSLMDALMSSEQTQQAPYRKQSGSIIANTLIQTLGTMLTKTRK